MSDARPYTHAALFGALWGAVESSLGALIGINPWIPSGLVMGGVGIVCLVTARRLAPRGGVTLLAGIVASAVVSVSVGGLRPGAIVGIVAGAGALELALSVSGSRIGGAIAGGALALTLAALQKIVVLAVLVGPEAASAAVGLLRRPLDAIGWVELPTAVVLALFVAIVALAGAATGAWSWRIAGRVARRVGAAA